MAENNKVRKVANWDTLLSRFPGFFASALKSAVTLFIHSIDLNFNINSHQWWWLSLSKKKLDNYIYMLFIVSSKLIFLRKIIHLTRCNFGGWYIILFEIKFSINIYMEKLRPRVDLNPLTLSPPCDRIKIREEPTITLPSSFLSFPQFEGKNTGFPLISPLNLFLESSYRMWEKILISDRKSKKRKPTTDLITRKDTSHPAQNLKRKRRKKKGPKRLVLFSHCLHQQNYRIHRYGSLESHEKSWECFSAQQTRWTGFFRLFLSVAASLFPRQSCLFARILTGTSLYS